MQNGTRWSSRAFRQWLTQIKYLPKSLLFLVVPDVPRNAQATLAEWERWEAELRELGVPLAFALQNGMELEQVPCSADYLFIGGTDDWRYPRFGRLSTANFSGGRDLNRFLERRGFKVSQLTAEVRAVP